MREEEQESNTAARIEARLNPTVRQEEQFGDTAACKEARMDPSTRLITFIDIHMLHVRYKEEEQYRDTATHR